MPCAVGHAYLDEQEEKTTQGERRSSQSCFRIILEHSNFARTRTFHLGPQEAILQIYTGLQIS